MLNTFISVFWIVRLKSPFLDPLISVPLRGLAAGVDVGELVRD